MRSIVLSLLFVFLLSTDLLANNPPAWLVDAAKLPTPTFEIRDVPAYILRNEEVINVRSDGKLSRTVRWAVRILTRGGREEAIARNVYNTDSEKVKELNAWLIRRDGSKPIHYGKKEVMDIALADNDLYNEARVKLIDASDAAREGDVFGFETESEETHIFSQFQFRFQTNLPVALARLLLTLPADWKTESVTFNRDKVEPVVNGNSYSWTLNDLAPLRPEPNAPRSSSLAPRVAVSYYPPQGTAGQIKTFRNWNDVARWMAEVEETQSDVNDALAAKARELTANAKTELEKIQAIGRYVQQIQYISIQIGTGRGGGYKPRLATETFARSYGDCKDKANLMRAMLSVLRIPAFLVSITADDPNYVRVEWASPHQFNHCIIAIKVSDDTNASSVVTHPTLGRLLMFDPTDPYTAVGDIPEDQQGSYALIDHRDTDSLTKMPVMPSAMNRLERHIEATIGPSGEIKGKIRENSVGQAASTERSRVRRMSATEYDRMIGGWVSRGVSGAKTSNIVTRDDFNDSRFGLDVEFDAASYAQVMQGRLMIFRPAIVGRLDRLRFSDGRRQHPYMIDSTSYSETVQLKIPEGFAVDEMPDPVAIESPFGTYSVTFEHKGDKVIFTRSLDLKRMNVPAAQYDSVRGFFGRVHAVEQAQVVLVRK